MFFFFFFCLTDLFPAGFRVLGFRVYALKAYLGLESKDNDGQNPSAKREPNRLFLYIRGMSQKCGYLFGKSL